MPSSLFLADPKTPCPVGEFRLVNAVFVGVVGVFDNLVF